MWNQRERNSELARGFSKFTPVTFTAGRGYCAKSWNNCRAGATLAISDIVCLLRVRLLVVGRRHARLVKTATMLMARFDLLQFGALFVRKTRRHFLVRLLHNFADAPAGFRADGFQLCRSFVDDRRNFRDLVRCQIELVPNPMSHALTGHSAVRTETLTARVQRADKGASYSAGHEDQDESGHEFPLQRAVHCGNSQIGRASCRERV